MDPTVQDILEHQLPERDVVRCIVDEIRARREARLDSLRQARAGLEREVLRARLGPPWELTGTALS